MRKRYSFLSILILALTLATPTGAAENTVEMTLNDLDGKAHQLSSLRGKWVVLNFWATWCPPCLEEMPDLDRFHTRHKDKDAVVWGINYEDIDVKELREFVTELKITYPILQGTDDLEKLLEPLNGLPTTFVINPQGQLVASVEGPVTPESIEQFIQGYEQP